MPETQPKGSAIRAITLLAVAGFAAQAMVRVTDSLLPQIAADLDVTVGATSVVVTFYLLAHGSVQLIAGPMSDRFGKYLCVTIGATIAAAMVALCAVATSLPWLIAARVGSGVATGWIIPLAMAFIGDVIPYERRQHVLGTFLSGQILGQLFGQSMGGVLGDLFGWRNVFFLNAALLAIAAVALLFELIRNPITREGQAGSRPASGGGFATIFKDYPTVFRSPWARAVIVMAFIESAAVFGAFTYVGADLHLRFGVSFTLVGVFVGTFAIGGLIYSLSVRAFVSRLGQVGLAAGGGLLLAYAYVQLAFQPHAYLAPIAIIGVGLGFYMFHNTLQVNATQMTPEARGTAVGIFSSALYLGQTAGVAANGWVFDRFGAVPVFLASAVLMLALGLWFARAIKRRAAAGL